MNPIVLCSIFIIMLLTCTVTARSKHNLGLEFIFYRTHLDEPYAEIIVAADPKSMDRTHKQGEHTSLFPTFILSSSFRTVSDRTYCSN